MLNLFIVPLEHKENIEYRAKLMILNDGVVSKKKNTDFPVRNRENHGINIGKI